MADLISFIQDEMLDDTDEGVFDQGDGPPSADVDENLPPFLRITKYALYDRLMVPRVLVDIFQTSSPDVITKDLPEIMQYFINLAEQDDDVAVKTEFIKQMPNVATTALLCAAQVRCLSTVLPNYILPFIVRNLSTSDNQVRNATHNVLFALLEQGLISKVQAEVQICPTILALSQEANLMDYTGAVTLMSKMTAYLGREVTERVFLERFAQLCSNSMFCVRKVCASHFGDFCAVVSQEAFNETLLPCFIAMCSDEIWGVRKACAEVIVSISCACTPQTRRSVLASVFVKLLQDESRWVCLAAFQALGPFISTFAEGLVFDQSGDLVVNVENQEEINRVDYELSPSSSNFPEEVDLSFHSLDVLDLDVTHNPLATVSDDNTTSGGVTFYNCILPSQIESRIFRSDPDSLSLTTSSLASVREKVIKKKKNEKTNDSISSDDDYSEKGDVKEKKDEKEEEEEAVVVTEAINTATTVTTNHVKTVNDVNIHSVNLEENTVDEKEEEKNEDTTKLKETNNQNETSNQIETSNQKESDSQIENEKVEEEDPLKEFNCFNFWHVKPDMTIDPAIIDVGVPLRIINDLGGAEPGSNVTFMDVPLNKFDKEIEEVPDSDVTFFGIPLDKLEEYDWSSSPITTQMFPGLAVIQNIKASDDSSLDVVPKFLVDFYVSMTDPNLAQYIDSEIAYHCAYSLPAVALTLGRKNWHLLKGTVEILAADLQYKVRRTVASSLHELAVILGPEIANTSLAPIFDGFIKDLDEVRIGILRHLAHFLKFISPRRRALYLPRFSEFLKTDNETNWRFRKELAEQLLLAIPLFRPIDATKYVSVLAQELLCDKVAAVREVALLLVAGLLRHVSANRSITPWLLVKLAEKFAHSKKWKRRQSFALLCAELLSSRAVSLEQFSSEVMPHLLDLSWDPVANVRIVVARTISKHVVTQEYFMDSSSQHYDTLQTALRRLQADKDRDVRHSANCQIPK